jgi:4-hydroxy-2-oxoheptanedioate aldolase
LADLKSIVFCIMIEKSIAVDHLDAILARARELGVDMTQRGPADFSFSRGEPSLQHSEAIKPFEALVIQKSLEYGIHPRTELGSVEQAKRYLDMGVRHFCIGWDRFILRQQLVSLGTGMRKLTDRL